MLAGITLVIEYLEDCLPLTKGLVGRRVVPQNLLLIMYYILLLMLANC